MKDVAVEKVSQVADLAEETLTDLSQRLDQAAEAVTEFVQETTRALKRELRHGWERVEEATLDVEHQIRRHPFQAVLIALGTGAVIGWLIGRAFSGRK